MVTVEAPAELRVARLVAERAMSEQEAWDRVRAQASDDERRRVARIVVVNTGSPDDLGAAVDGVWERLGEMGPPGS